MKATMLSKDLLYALQTRSKKMIRELDGFTDGVRRIPYDDGWTVVLETIGLVREVAPTQDKYSHLIKAVNRAWLAFGEQSEQAAERLYGTILDALEQTDWTRANEAQAAYQLLYALHDNHLRFGGTNQAMRAALRRNAARLFGLVDTIVPYAGQTLFPTPVKPERGVGADAIEMLLELFFRHSGLMEDQDLRAQAGGLLPLLVRAYPAFGNNLTLALLEDHPERAAIVCQLIELYLGIAVHANLDGMFFDIMLDLVDNDGSSFIYTDLDKIVRLLEAPSRGWNARQFETFAEYAFFYRLKTDEDRRLLLTKSKKARKLAALIVESGHRGEHIDALAGLYRSLEPGKAAPPPVGVGAEQFQDLNFKLLVIQALMYHEEKLTPRFDVREFARRYTAREVMIEDEGYDPIPEVLDHFRGLPIAPELLARVEELGFDGGLEIYSQICPYWDGEDDVFDPVSAADVALLPNLRRLSGMTQAFVARHGEALRCKGIEVDSDR